MDCPLACFTDATGVFLRFNESFVRTCEISNAEAIHLGFSVTQTCVPDPSLFGSTFLRPRKICKHVRQTQACSRAFGSVSDEDGNLPVKHGTV